MSAARMMRAFWGPLLVHGGHVEALHLGGGGEGRRRRGRPQHLRGRQLRGGRRGRGVGHACRHALASERGSESETRLWKFVRYVACAPVLRRQIIQPVLIQNII